MRYKKDNLSLTQSNNLIEAHYSANLTTVAHKVAKLIVALINPEKHYSEAMEVTVDISKLKHYLGWSQGKKWNRFLSDLKDISGRLNFEPIEILNEGGSLTVAYFLSSYTIDLKKGEVTFELGSKIVPYLTQLKKNFTTYQLKYIPKLTSSYAIRMYELFHQHLRIGHRRFTVEAFRKKVGAPMTYKYNDLKKRVVIPAQEQLKENTDIAFMYNEIKAGRSVVGLEFIIFGNTPSQSGQMELGFLADALGEEEKIEPAFSERVVGAMKDIGIAEQNIAKLLAEGFNIITDKQRIPVAQERCGNLEGYYLEKLALAERSGSKINAAGFVIKALKEDWVSEKAILAQKGRVAARRKNDTEMQIRALEKEAREISKKREELLIPIVEGLMADEAIAQSVYEAVMDTAGLIKQHIARYSHLPIRQQYKESAFLNSGMNIEFAKRYPDRFAETQALLEQLKKANDRIKSLQKQ